MKAQAPTAAAAVADEGSPALDLFAPSGDVSQPDNRPVARPARGVERPHGDTLPEGAPLPPVKAALIAGLSAAELAGWCAGCVLVGRPWWAGEAAALAGRARALGVAPVLAPAPEAALAVLRGEA